MLKIFSFVLCPFCILVPGILFSRPLPANSNSPSWVISQGDVPFCYMETPDGQSINLGNLCRQESEAASTCASGAAGMPIANVRYDSNTLTGQVTNRTCNTVQLVKVNYQVLDSQGNEIDNGFIYTQPSVIPQGQTASFGAAIAPGSEVSVTHVEWNNIVMQPPR